MMDIDKTWIQEKFTASKPYLAILNELISTPKDSFVTDFKLRLQAERIFEVLSQIMLDVCSHIVARSENTPPSTYSDCMQLLVDIGVISGKKLPQLIPLIRMRNLIVHQYGIIDPSVVHASLRELARDFAGYEKDILAWLE